ncbi:hypothetical protein [Morganella morganii]|uniref:hypothetical protein n=1 Tax=Morganella morganii TaxID=582 RepID=UPI002713D73F|nr:hypothetical protein [Morganella morganii]MDO7861422.1 hypothetical protein [Morganella morganii]
MENLIKALDMSIKTKNWHSVLFISLALPDICGKIDEPNKGSKARTINWFNKYLKPIYSMGEGEDIHIFLSGADFYALRCSCLHEGSSDITSQKARETLDRFSFIEPAGDMIIHRIQVNNSLHLQVDQFGEDVLVAVKNWLNDISNDKEKISKMENMLHMRVLDPSKDFFI